MSNAQPEHALQVMVNKFVREAVPQPHFFCGVDRSKATSRFTHAREKARGLIAGTPDTLLVCPGLPLIAVELKAPGNTPTEQQEQVGADIQASGHVWGWCDTVTGYAAILRAAGVALHPRADIYAAGHDATLSNAMARRKEAKASGTIPARRSKPQAAKPSAAKLRRVAALRSRVMF